MIKNKKGSIINISSNAAVECDAGRSGYSSSKAALIAWTKVLSKELGDFNIRVNAVSPGLTNTDMGEKDVSKNIKSLGNLAPFVNRLLTVESCGAVTTKPLLHCAGLVSSSMASNGCIFGAV